MVEINNIVIAKGGSPVAIRYFLLSFADYRVARAPRNDKIKQKKDSRLGVFFVFINNRSGYYC